ncbi:MULTISPECIES: hypothetical protein [Paenibacillus]|uniref:competence protein CoiA family protein n=1 Tax=Paenibacillus TaxID=44249 RepID=UPI002FE19E5A
MDWAIDPITNEEISAYDQNISKYHGYLCPSCEAPVQLRKGKKRVYFAHAIGQANPECEKYMPGTYAEKLLLKAVQQEVLSRTLGLYIRIFEDTERYYWCLEIGIPEPDRTYGCLKVPYEKQGERTIPINQIKSGGLRIGVNPKESAYKLIVDNLTEGDWYNRVIQPIEGLSNFTVFKYSPQGGRRLRQNQSLFWGKTYIILWKVGADPGWYPNAEGLVIRSLYKLDSWTGIIINLPINYNNAVQTWVRQRLKRKVEFPPTDITLVTPVPLTRLPDNSLVIEPQSDVLISVVGTASSKKWNEIFFHSSSENRITRHRGNGATPYLISLGRLENGKFNIWIDNEFENGIQLAVASHEPKVSLESPSIKFIGYKHDTNELVSVSLHSSKTYEFIKSWYSKNIILEKIDVPSRLSINIRWGVAGENKTYERDLVDNSMGPSVADQLCALLNDFLSMDLTHLVIEATEYGRVCVNFKTKVDKKINMSADWRMRVKWLLVHSMGNGFRNIRTAPYWNNQYLNYLCALDKTLVIKLLNSLIPVEFSSQYITIIKELNKAVEDRRKN